MAKPLLGTTAFYSAVSMAERFKRMNKLCKRRPRGASCVNDHAAEKAVRKRQGNGMLYERSQSGRRGAAAGSPKTARLPAAFPHSLRRVLSIPCFYHRASYLSLLFLYIVLRYIALAASFVPTLLHAPIHPYLSRVLMNTLATPKSILSLPSLLPPLFIDLCALSLGPFT